MNKEQFEKVAIGVVVFSLLFIPPHECAPGRCYPRGWEFIFDSTYSIDFGKLFIQEIIIGLILYYFWKRNYKN